jgi:hypothetical protein
MGLVISSSLTLTQTERDENAARIGYHKLSGTITATNEAVAYPATSAGNPLTYSFWRPTSLPSYWEIDFGTLQSVDYIGIASHELGSSGCSCVAQYWNGSAWIDLYSFAPGVNTPILLLFDEIQTPKIRIGILSGVPPRVGVVYVGQSLTMERPIYGGHSPITLTRTTVYKNNASESGQWLGRSVRRGGAKTTFEWKNLTAAWYRENFDSFASAARFAPFFIAWRPFTFANEVGYVWTNNDIAPTNTGQRDLMSVSISVEGLAVD